MSEQREAIAKVIFGDEWLFDSQDKMYTTLTAEGLRHGALEQAGDVIAHLWEQADDPETVARMQEVIQPWNMQPALVRGFLMADLTALLGPRPQGGDDATD